MATPPKRPTVAIWLGVAFVVAAVMALPWALDDPSGTSPRGIPNWFLSPFVLFGGVFFIVYGVYWRSRSRRDG